MVMDIPIKIFFGTFNQSPFDISARGFSSKDIKIAPKYLMKLYQFLSLRNVIEQSNKLVANSIPNHKEAEQINRDLTRGCQYTENCCRH